MNAFVAIFFFFSSTVAIFSQRASAFSSPSNRGDISALYPCLSSLIDDGRQRIGRRIVIRNSRLFADATSSVVETPEQKEDAFPTDPAKTTPEFLAGLWVSK